jgi:hypothetical protein
MALEFETTRLFFTANEINETFCSVSPPKFLQIFIYSKKENCGPEKHSELEPVPETLWKFLSSTWLNWQEGCGFFSSVDLVPLGADFSARLTGSDDHDTNKRWANLPGFPLVDNGIGGHNSSVSDILHPFNIRVFRSV